MKQETGVVEKFGPKKEHRGRSQRLVKSKPSMKEMLGREDFWVRGGSTHSESWGEQRQALQWEN